ncbi:MAG: hypothetical protein ACRC7N_18405 [Clostridium sp.]
MLLDLIIEKKLSKPFYYLHQEGTIEVIITNKSPHKIDDLFYEEEFNECISIDYNNITVNGDEYIMGINQKNITLSEILPGDRVSINIKFKVCDVNEEEKCKLISKISYINGEEEVSEIKSSECIVKGVKLEFKSISREREVLFGNETSRINVSIINKGNVVASNIILKYLSSGRMSTFKSEAIIDGTLYKGMFIDSGINIGSLLKGETREVSFLLKGNKNIKEYGYDYVEVFYEGIVNPFIVSEGRYIREKLNPILSINNDISMEREGEIYFEDNQPFLRKVITIKNNSGVDIERFILKEEIDFSGELIEVGVEGDNTFTHEGNTVIINRVLMKKTYKILLTYKVKCDVSRDLKLQSEASYNLGSNILERRFKKINDPLVIPLEINMLSISEKTSKDTINLLEKFHREIEVENISDKLIERIILYDKYSERISISSSSFKIDNKKINNIENLDEGIELGELIGKGILKIEYDGYFKGPLRGDVIKKSTYCKYKVSDNTKSIRELKSKVIDSIMGIECDKYKLNIETILDISRLNVKEIMGIRVNGEIVDSKGVRGFNENSTNKLLISNSYLITGKLEINLDYSSNTNKNKILNMNLQSPFRELIQGRETSGIVGRNDKPLGKINVITNSYTISNSILKIITTVEICI